MVRESLRSRGWVEQFYRDESSHDSKLPASKALKTSSDHNSSDIDSDGDDLAYDGDGNIINGVLCLLFSLVHLKSAFDC